VEASAATAFRSKHERALVGAAGMAAELFLAALAFYLWLLVEPGPVRAVLFNVMVIASVSTLVFNGNPLLRYDAYYILMDLIEIPNLAARSARYWGYLIERHALGVRDAQQPEASASEKAWFVFYGAASTVYRVLVTVAIALFIAGRFFVIGVLLAAWAVIAMAGVPLVRGIRHLAGPRLRHRRGRAMRVALGCAAALAVLLFVVPMPHHSQVEGVVWLPEQAMVRPGADGFIGEFLAAPGKRVARGDPLIRCIDPTLSSQLRYSQAKVAELEAEYASAFATDRTKAELVRQGLEAERSALAVVSQKAGELVIKAASDGVFVVPEGPDLLGRYYRKGALLGYVIGDVAPLARVVVPQEAADLVRQATQNVGVRLVNHPGWVAHGSIVRQVPAGEEYLPSRALAMEGGGAIATDPRDSKGPKTLERMFQFEVVLSDIPKLEVFGERVYVRFDHDMEPLAHQWYRGIRLLFLSRFGV
jgi:putative peptide zinc metalloprotease protein